MLEANMIEALVIILALGGLEVILWWADQHRQNEQLATLEAIWVELATMNEEKQRQIVEPVLASETQAPTNRPTEN